MWKPIVNKETRAVSEVIQSPQHFENQSYIKL